MKKVICTAMSGVGTREYLSSVKEQADKSGKRIEVFDVGQQILQIARDRGQLVMEERILNRHTPTLYALRSAAFEKLQSQVNELSRSKNAPDALIVDLHAIFPWKNSLIMGLDPWYLQKLEPALYIALADDIINIERGLRERKNWGWLGLEQMLSWRDLEVFFSEAMAGFASTSLDVRVPHYLLGLRGTEKTFLDLAINSQKKKAYVSYPITHVEKGEIQKAQKLAEDLSEYLVVFNPMSIQDMDVVKPLEALLRNGPNVAVVPPPSLPGFDETEQESRTKEVGDFVERIRERLQSEGISKQQLRLVIDHLRDQTVARDYQLISQSDMVIVRYPPTRLDLQIVNGDQPEDPVPDAYCIIDETTGEAPAEELVGLSAGVLSEMVYGFTNDKEVYAIWLPETDPSPFFTYHCTRWFRSDKQFWEFIKRQI